MTLDAEQLETARQAIMRFRELLDLMRYNWEEANQAYEQLFANVSPEDRQTLREKDQQKVAAQDVVADATALSQAALHMRLHARNMERDFEQLYNNVVAIAEMEEE